MPVGYQPGIDRQKLIRIQGDEMAENIAFARSFQIEIGMIGQVQHGWLVGDGKVVEAQVVVIGERVGNGCREIAGIAFFAILALIGQFERATGQFARGPDAFVEAPDAAVQ